MPLSEITLNRLKDLEELLSVQYRKLSAFQNEWGITSNINSKFEIGERIRKEIFPAIVAYAQEYFEMVRRTHDQAKTEKIEQLLVSIRTQLVSANLPELAQKINDLSPPSSVPASMSISSVAPIPAPVQVTYPNQATGGSMIKILFLGVNPKNTDRLRIDEEIHKIKSKLRESEHRDKFQIEQEWAVQVSDLQRLLLQHKPHIVHFSGHGNTSGEIALEDVNGKSQPIPIPALKRLFTNLKDNIRCVVLNACYSEAQAQALSEAIDCVVGMNDSIGDKAAIAFAASFYQALGFGENLDKAFKLGCNEIALHGIKGENTPQLRHQPTVDPKAIVLVNP